MLTAPVPHLNGTSKTALIQQNLEAADALRDAREKVVEAEPHARDYYHTGGYEKARAEFDAVLMMLDKMIADFDWVVVELMDE